MTNRCYDCGRFIKWGVDYCPPHQPWFINHYTCPGCGHKWTDKWSAMCDDDCPSCGLRHITPTHSDDA